jgi:hypothetical protein
MISFFVDISLLQNRILIPGIWFISVYLTIIKNIFVICKLFLSCFVEIEITFKFKNNLKSAILL